MEQERLSKGLWIPIEIWKDKNLTWNEKILFLEIDSYTSCNMDCYFSNEYISELLGISETNANKTLSSLISKGYVIKTKFDGRRRYVKTALSYSTTLPCQERQPSRACVFYTDNNYTDNSTLDKTTNKEENSKKEELFEDCWTAYNRKGSKKKSKEQWMKLSSEEKDKVLPHIKVYASSRERQYQRDFERYLRDKVFNDIVSKGNVIIYDPTQGLTNEYRPQQSFELCWNDNYSVYMYVGMDTKHIPDGYTDSDRPNGASIMLNNGRGTIVWNANIKQWEKKK